MWQSLIPQPSHDNVVVLFTCIKCMLLIQFLSFISLSLSLLYTIQYLGGSRPKV